MLHLLLQQKQNSRQFWKKVKKLGVAGIESQSIPMEVELEDGSISSDKSVVMSKWLASFKSLLNPESGSSLQNCPLDPTIQSTDSSELNTPITKDEVKTALHQAPSNKALGIDNYILIMIVLSTFYCHYLITVFLKGAVRQHGRKH